MFDIPSNPNIVKCIITKETVVDKKEPDVITSDLPEEKNLLKNVKRKLPPKENKETA